MTQTTTEQNNPDHPRLEAGEESENFSKVVKTESGHLAIVDAAILRSNPHPLAKEAVIFPTKQTPGEMVAFSVQGVYDDAILRELKMEPADIEEVQKHEQKQDDKEDVEQSKEKMREDIQIRGHDRRGGLGNSVAKKTREIDNKVTDPIQQKKKRKSTKEPKDPKTNVTDHVSAQMAQRVSIKGAERDNYGQPRAKTEKGPKSEELSQFLKHVKDKSVTIQVLDGMQFTYQINEGLKALRSKIATGEQRGNLDLVCESVAILDNYHRTKAKTNIEMFENLFREGLPLV